MSNDFQERLRELGANHLGHTDRSLMDHLVGTGEILRQWDCDEDVCIAGVFHSIYGTNAFVRSCMDKDDRDRLRDMIGTRAERLVFLFCASNRPAAFLEAVHERQLVNRYTGEVMKAPSTVVRQLLEIECANLIEQRTGHGFMAELLSFPKPVLKRRIVNDVRKFIDHRA
ncbi:MAG TPA: hypothetical protein VGH80_04505 [Xanthomonadaceae bacterium]|jgi:hypothetical protein